MFFSLKWVRISLEIDWYHYYQCASLATICIVRQKNRELFLRVELSLVISEPSVEVRCGGQAIEQEISINIQQTELDK